MICGSKCKLIKISLLISCNHNLIFSIIRFTSNQVDTSRFLLTCAKLSIQTLERLFTMICLAVHSVCLSHKAIQVFKRVLILISTGACPFLRVLPRLSNARQSIRYKIVYSYNLSKDLEKRRFEKIHRNAICSSDHCSHVLCIVSIGFYNMKMLSSSIMFVHCCSIESIRYLNVFDTGVSHNGCHVAGALITCHMEKPDR